jgi:hypothetical protein
LTCEVEKIAKVGKNCAKHEDCDELERTKLKYIDEEIPH